MAYHGTPYRVLGKLIGANFNSTADQAIIIAVPKYYLGAVFITNASISLTTAAGGLYTAASKAGTALVSAAQVYNSLTAASKIMGATVVTTDTNTAQTLYFSLTTAQGAAATGDIFLCGLPFYE